MTFEEELSELINKRSIEGQSDTPDFILAKFLKDSLAAWTNATRNRDSWYGQDPLSSMMKRGNSKVKDRSK